MSAWQRLLEALHSALIDKITERYPEPKPELGLPQRVSGWKMPGGGPGASLSAATMVIVCPVTLSAGSSQGIVALGLEPGCQKALGASAWELWDCVLARARRTEFERKGLEPIFGAPDELGCQEPPPKGMCTPSQLIWIPVKVAGSGCFLGVGA